MGLLALAAPLGVGEEGNPVCVGDSFIPAGVTAPCWVLLDSHGCEAGSGGEKKGG